MNGGQDIELRAAHMSIIGIGSASKHTAIPLSVPLTPLPDGPEDRRKVGFDRMIESSSIYENELGCRAE